MKRIITGALALVIFTTACLAAQLPTGTTRKAAVNFWNTHRTANNKTIDYDTPQLITFAELPMMHIYAIGSEGFVIVSAERCVDPVLGYSFDSPATENLNPEAAYWLRWLNAQIAAAVAEGYTSATADSLWDDLLYSPVPPTPLTLDAVPMLLQTRWDQGHPYNNLCPYDSNYHARAVVGCVATAMAQIMKYWNHPSSGTGSHSFTHRSMSGGGSYGVLSADFEHTTYIWSYMPDAVEAQVSGDPKAEKAAALISYHCGVAVDMMYGPSATGGSGAYSACGYWTTACAENAFKDYFKYSEDLQYVGRNGHTWYNGSYVETYYYSDSAWCAILDQQLNNATPMYYSGSDSTGGHAFVLDGRDQQHRYHFNWGWSGSYNGYYHINNIAPGSGGIGGNATYSFNQGQGAIIGIVPIPEHFDSVAINDTACLGSGYYHFHDYEFPLVTDTVEAVWLDTVYTIFLKIINQRTLYLNANGGTGFASDVDFCPIDGVVLPECNYTRSGYYFIGWGEKRNGNSVIYHPGDTLHIRGSKTVYAQWSTNNAITDVDNAEPITLWPNPTTGDVSVSVNMGHVMQVSVIDDLGRTMIRKDNPDSDEDIKLSLADLPNGVYTIQVKSASGIYNNRIIKQ